MLRVYVADDCPGSPTARQRANWLREQAPELPVEVIDIGVPGAVVPPAVFGTPTYTWNERLLFLGNPSAQELIELKRGCVVLVDEPGLRAFSEQGEGRPRGTRES